MRAAEPCARLVGFPGAQEGGAGVTTERTGYTSSWFGKRLCRGAGVRRPGPRMCAKVDSEDVRGRRGRATAWADLGTSGAAFGRSYRSNLGRFRGAGLSARASAAAYDWGC